MEFYVVFTTYSFDPDVPSVSFLTEQEAKDYLRKTYEEELRIATTENALDYTCVGEIADDGRSAKITEELCDHTDVTEFLLTTVKTPEFSVMKANEDTGAAQPAEGDSTPLHLYAACPNCGNTTFLRCDDDGSFKCPACGDSVFPEDMGLKAVEVTG